MLLPYLQFEARHRMYMKLREDQEKVRTLLCDTVTLLCKNGLSFSKELRVEGLLGITLDQTEVFIVHINEKLYSDDINGVVKDSAQHQKTRKRGHLDNDAVEVSPPKKQNHIGATDYSLSGKTDLYDTFNNNVADPFTKCPKQEPEDERENNAFIEDDRNAMRFCYNLENEEDESAHDIPEGGTGSVQGKSHPTMEVSAPSIVKEESHSPGGSNSSTGCGEDPLNELKPPDPSMGGPFITGIVNNNMEIHSAANEDDEEDDKAWNELPQLGTLIHDSSSLVPEGGTWTTTSVGGATGKGRRQGKSPDSVNI